MPDPSTPVPGPGLWSRRWFRRVTYLIASGAALVGLVAWTVTRDATDRWLIGKLDEVVTRETGLRLQAERLEFHPLAGRILLHRLALGGDLLQARLLELDLEWASILHTPHIRRILLLEPALNLDRTRLARIKLRPHQASSTTPRFQLDRLEITNGQAHVREAAWGLPSGDFRFELTGKGWTANQLWVEARMPGIVLGQGQDAILGDLALTANVTDKELEAVDGQLSLGANRLTFKGGYRYLDRFLELEAGGHLDLVQVQRLAGPAKPAATGLLDFQAQVNGPLDQPTWNGTIQGSGLQAKALPLRPGSLQIAARGGPAEIRLERLAWASAEGRLQASGNWTARTGYQLKLEANAIPLAPMAGYTRAGFLKELSLRFQGKQACRPDCPGRPGPCPSWAA